MKVRWRVLWWVYAALLLLVVILKFKGSFEELANKAAATAFGTNCNLIPFKSIGAQLAHFREGWARFNLLGNVIPFVPFGLLLPLAYPKLGAFGRFLAVAALSLLAAELLQFFTRLGSFDVDDLLLNLAGILGGYAVYRLCRARGRRRTSAR